MCLYLKAYYYSHMKINEIRFEIIVDEFWNIFCNKINNEYTPSLSGLCYSMRNKHIPNIPDQLLRLRVVDYYKQVFSCILVCVRVMFDLQATFDLRILSTS